MLLILGYRNNGTSYLHTSRERIIIAEEVLVVMRKEGAINKTRVVHSSRLGKRRKKSVEHSMNAGLTAMAG